MNLDIQMDLVIEEIMETFPLFESFPDPQITREAMKEMYLAGYAAGVVLHEIPKTREVE